MTPTIEGFPTTMSGNYGAPTISFTTVGESSYRVEWKNDLSAASRTTVTDADNAENLMVLRDEKIAQEYEQNWQAHLTHSVPYLGK